jgi:hypothetical protein
MATAKQQVIPPLEKFLSKYDLSLRTKVEQPYSWLKHKLDTRIDGSANAEFAEELEHSFKDKSDALDELLKFPIEVTGDGVVVVGRALARAMSSILVTPGDPDPLIPFETYDEIPNFEKLSDEDKAGLRLYAVKRDRTKTKQRGLGQEDNLYNVRQLVILGWSKDRIVTGSMETGLSKWKAEELYRLASNSETNKKYGAAAEEVKELKRDKKPVNFDKICVKHGLDPKKYASKLEAPRPRSRKPAQQNNLTKKQRWTVATPAKSVYGSGTPQSLADNNITWYRDSENGTLAEGTQPLSGDVFIGLTRSHFRQALNLMNFWKDALDRAEAEVARLSSVRKAASRFNS